MLLERKADAGGRMGSGSDGETAVQRGAAAQFLRDQLSGVQKGRVQRGTAVDGSGESKPGMTVIRIKVRR